MKLLVFGATGASGREVVRQALESGHEVTAFVRNPEKLELKDENLTLFEGDVLTLDAVITAMQGQDAVLCCLGAPANNKQFIRAEGTKNIILAMQKEHVKRLICQTSLGYGDSRAVLPWHMKYIVVPLILRSSFQDHALQETYIKESDLAWTIVRPGALTDGELTGTYQHGFATTKRRESLSISRADVADFMLKQRQDDTYLYQTPALAY